MLQRFQAFENGVSDFANIYAMFIWETLKEYVERACGMQGTRFRRSGMTVQGRFGGDYWGVTSNLEYVEYSQLYTRQL